MEKITEDKVRDIEYFSDGSFIYVKKDEEMTRLAIFDNGYYRLRPWKGIPILEVDGLRMQLVNDFKDPFEYPREVVRALRIKRGGNVLDTCMGLGYTALALGKKAGHVTTCERSDAVYTLASWNPYSRDMFDQEKYEILRGDISGLITDLKEGTFDAIVHDPPRFSKAGELYSFDFYKSLFRVAKKGSRLFHYVGHPGKSRGRRINLEVRKRLERAGFGKIRNEKRLQGLICEKIIP